MKLLIVLSSPSVKSADRLGIGIIRRIRRRIRIRAEIKMRLDRTGYHVEQFVGITCIAYSLLDRTDMTDRTDRQTEQTDRQDLLTMG